MSPPLQFEVLDADGAAIFLVDDGALVVDDATACAPAVADGELAS